MAFLPIFMLLLLAISSSMPAYSNAAYCVCNSGVSDPVLQKNIDYACGAGADCGQISPNGPCFNPNTVKDHCNFAVNSYYQKKGQVDGSCVFSGTATVVQTPPSGVNSACLSGNPSTSTPAPPGTGTGTPPSGTGTPGTGTPPSGTGTPGTGTPPSGTGTPGTGTPPSGTGTPGTGTPPSGTGTPGTGTPPSGTGTPGMGTPGTGTGTGTGIGTGGGTGINVNPPIGMGPAGTSGYGGDSSGCGCIHHDQMITTILSLPTLLVSGLIWFLQM